MENTYRILWNVENSFWGQGMVIPKYMSGDYKHSEWSVSILIPEINERVS